MAGLTHVVTPGTLTPPWPLAIELASALPERSWALVGGLMVHVHALRAGVIATRPTRDVDALLNIQANSAGEMGRMLTALSFEAVEPSRENPLHRFVRDDDVVDVMVARDVHEPTRWAQRPLLRSPGAAQALQRLDTYTLLVDGARSLNLSVPDSLGAIIIKAAAYAVDPRNPERHLEDLAVLAASTGSPRNLALDTLTRKDRRHLSRVVPPLSDQRHRSWEVLDSYDREIAQRVWSRIAATLRGA